MSADQVSVVERLRSVLTDCAAIRLAILFGSRARDAARPGSDVDVGIIPHDPQLALTAELDLHARLERVCGSPVDLVRLDRASTLLRWEAAINSVVLVASFPGEFSRFVAAAALEHADLMTTLGRPPSDFGARSSRPKPVCDGGGSEFTALTDPILVLHKLTTLRDHVGRARRRRPASPEELRSDVDRQDALAMSLLVAIQELSQRNPELSRPSAAVVEANAGTPMNVSTLRGARETIDARSRVVEQLGLLRRRTARRQPLERVPQHLVATARLVHREVRLEHAAIGAELFDREFVVVPVASASSWLDGGRGARASRSRSTPC